MMMLLDCWRVSMKWMKSSLDTPLLSPSVFLFISLVGLWREGGREGGREDLATTFAMCYRPLDITLCFLPHLSGCSMKAPPPVNDIVT